MILTALKFKIFVFKFKTLLFITFILFLISLCALIYGLYIFASAGEFAHGDHTHVKQAFEWEPHSQIIVITSSILAILFLSVHISLWCIMYKDQIWWLNFFKYKKNNATKLVVKKIKNIQDLQLIKRPKISLKQRWHNYQNLNVKTQTYKISLTAILLAISLILSMIEFSAIVLPWGSALKLRLFEVLVILLSIKLVGNFYAMIIGGLGAWLHFAIHPVHLPIDVVFNSINNVLIVIVFYLVYYVLFKAEAQFMQDKNHNLYLVNTKAIIVRKIFALLIFGLICSLLEALALYGSYFIITGNYTSVQHKIYYESLTNTSLVNPLNAFYFIIISWIIFSLKYFIESLIFISIEKQTIFIKQQFNLN